MQAIPEGSWWWWGFLYLDCTNVNIFVDTLYHSIARCYHWRGMGKGYAGSLCITSNCTWIYNDLKIRHVINTSVGAECNSAQKLIFTVLCYGRLNMLWLLVRRVPQNEGLRLLSEISTLWMTQNEWKMKQKIQKN